MNTIFLKNFLSRYSPKYVRSLVYMMQASEYHVRDFVRWYLRTLNFAQVEQRKKLVVTPKAFVFLSVGYLVLGLLYVFVVWAVLVGIVWWKYLLSLFVFLGAPIAIVITMVGLLLVSRYIQMPVEYFIVASAKEKLRMHPAHKIAVAGSFGKTSMREILKTVLGAGKKVAAPPRSYNTPLGISAFVKSLKGDEEVLIFEMGEYYPKDIKRLCAFVQPTVGVITGVNEAHLEKFKDIERTKKTIFELADYLGDKPIYVNGENELAQKNGRPTDLLYSRFGVGSWKVQKPKSDVSGTSFVLQNESSKVSVRSQLLGLHQIGPLSVAVDMAADFGLSLEAIERGISETKPFEHRLEPRTDVQGITILDDSYNGNPDGVRAVIEFLSSLRGGRRWYVTPGLVEMGKKKEDVHKEIGAHLAKAGIEKVVLVKNSVTPFIAMGLRDARYSGEVVWFDRALDAFAALPNLTVKGDIVLLQNDWPDQYA